MNKMYAVIMAGGSGERFWPKSRRNLPKQLLPIVTKNSIIKETIGRLEGLIPEDRIFIVTNKSQERLIRKETKCKNIIKEKVARNTAPCIALSAEIIQKKDKDAIMVTLPADHQIKDVNNFRKTILKAVDIASRESVLVTLGIKPKSPHTGYGYIEKGERLGNGLFKVSRFTEKPDLKTAKKYVKSNGYFWNSGMFVWSVGAILDEIKKYLPNIWNSNEKISIDYGVMEKTGRAVVLEAGFNWDDVGNWASLDNHRKKDGSKNVKEGKVVVKDVNNSTIITDSPLIAMIGVSDLIVVGTKDAVLICPKDRAEEVKGIVEILKKNRKLRKYI